MFMYLVVLCKVQQHTHKHEKKRRSVHTFRHHLRLAKHVCNIVRNISSMLGATHETKEKKQAVKLSFALLQPNFLSHARDARLQAPVFHVCTPPHTPLSKEVSGEHFCDHDADGEMATPYSKHDVSLTPSMHGYDGANIFLQMCSMANTRPIHLPGHAFSHCTQTVHTYIQYMHTGARYMCFPRTELSSSAESKSTCAIYSCTHTWRHDFSDMKLLTSVAIAPAVCTSCTYNARRCKEMPVLMLDVVLCRH